jgi:hypothetical protein
MGLSPLIAAAPAGQGLTRSSSGKLRLDEDHIRSVLAEGRLAAGAVAGRQHLVALGHKHGSEQSDQALVCVGHDDSHAHPQGWPAVNR